VTVLATFLGMLELSRIKSILIRQASLFGEIRLYRRADLNAGPAASADPGNAPSGTGDGA